MPQTHLEACNVTKTYGDGIPIHVLRGVSLICTQGKTHAIVGASGSGKSTLLHILGGLDLPTSGEVLFNKHDLSMMNADTMQRFRSSDIGFVFQFHYLIHELSAAENIMLPGLIAKKSRDVCEHQAKKLLSYLGLEDRAGALPSTLSGGEQQRVAIARALFNEPKFLLADEPTGNLDAEHATRVADLFLKCTDDWNLGVVMVSHDPAVYNKMENIYHLEKGVLSKG